MLLFAGDLTQVGSAKRSTAWSTSSTWSMSRSSPCSAITITTPAAERVAELLTAAGISVLEGQSTVVQAGGHTLGVAGVKGFGGGFAGACASDFGEPEMKRFVRHTADAAGVSSAPERARHRLPRGAAALLADRRHAGRRAVAIYAFLGSYLLAEAMDRAGADLVLHGHAHRGTERGMTPGGSCRNVAQPVIGAPYCVFELDGGESTTLTEPIDADHDDIVERSGRRARRRL